ncbi:MAG: hydrogenase nickel incorporation protein HypA [Opitutales bacterium]|nr:hydrogenase nickel incorporation protein HypA [Opitutales bacterium]
MPEISINAFFTAYILGGMSVVFALWLYYDRRDRILCDRQRFRHAYRCIKCGELYDRRGQREVAPCPKCGFANDRLRF